MFRKGQPVVYRGQQGVVEAVNLTPGMVDVRYGSLVKRHAAGEVQAVARRNAGEGSSEPTGPQILAQLIRRLTNELNTLRSEIEESNAKVASLRRDLAEARLETTAQSIRRTLGEVEGQLRAQESEYRKVEGALAYWSAGGAAKEQEAYDNWLLSEEGRRVRAFQKQLKDKPAKPAPTKRGTTQSTYAAKLAAGAQQIELEKGAFFVLPDPPRFDFDPVTGDYTSELCGNTIDGSLYAVALNAKGMQKRAHLTQRQWNALLTQYQKDNPNKRLPEDIFEVVKMVRPFFLNLGYPTVAVRGRKQWAALQEGASGEVPGLTEEEVHAIRSGVVQAGGVEDTIARLQDQIAAQKRILAEAEKGSDAYRRAKSKLEVLIPALRDATAEAEASRKIFTPTPQLTRIRRPGKDRTRPAAELLAGTKGPKEKQLYEAPFPPDAFFWQQSDGTYVAIYGMARTSEGRQRLLTRFQPPWRERSGKRFSPFFSWVRLNRPLASGEERGWYTAPLCVTERHSEIAETTRKILRPVREARSSMSSLRNAITTYAGEPLKTATSARRVTEATLRSVAWLASYLQDAEQTLQLMPASMRDSNELYQLLRMVLETPKNPWGVNAQLLLYTAMFGPVRLLSQEPLRRARVLDRDRIQARIEDLLNRENLSAAEKSQLEADLSALSTPMPPRYQAIVVAESGKSAERIQEEIEKLEEALRVAAQRNQKNMVDRLQAQINQLQDRLGSSIAGRVEEALRKRTELRTKSSRLEGLQAIRGAIIGPEDLAYLVADALFNSRIASAEGQRKQNLQEAKIHAVSELEVAARPLFGSDPESAEKLRVLRAGFYVYHALGGDDLVRRLMHAEDMLKRVREDAGRIPSDDFASQRKLIRDTKAQLDAARRHFSAELNLPKELAELQSIEKELLREVQLREHIETLKQRVYEASEAAARDRGNSDLARVLAKFKLELRRAESEYALIPRKQTDASIRPQLQRLQEEIARLKSLIESQQVQAEGVGSRRKTKAEAEVDRLKQLLEDLRAEERKFFQGQSPRLENTEYYYTFNPVLFAITQKYWNTVKAPFGTTKTASGQQTLTEAANTLMEDIDAAGRYGHSLKLLYESAKVSQETGSRSLADTAAAIDERVGAPYFLAEIERQMQEAGDIAGLSAAARQAQYKELAEKGERLLATRIYSDLEMMEQGRGGRTPLFQQYGSGAESYYMGWLPEMAEGGLSPWDVQTSASDLQADPTHYLTDLRQRAEDAMLRTMRPTRTHSSGVYLKDIPGVGEKTLEALAEIGVTTPEEARKVPMPLLKEAIGTARARNLKNWVLRWWQQGADVKPPPVLSPEERKAQAQKEARDAFRKEQSLKPGTKQPIPEERRAPMSRLKIPSHSPYKHARAWSETSVPSDYPAASSVAALEALQIDAEQLRSAVEQRKLILTRNRSR